jgi:hypothetical protein
MVVRRQRTQPRLDDELVSAQSELEGLIASTSIDPVNGSTTTTGTSASANGMVRKGGGHHHENTGGNSIMASLNLDHLTKPKHRITANGSPSNRATEQRKKSKSGGDRQRGCCTPLDRCQTRCSIVCLYYPKTCGALVLVSIALFLVILVNLDRLNPVQVYGTMSHDHFTIHSIYDVKMGDIDHWCLGGGNVDCTCQDPLTPVHRGEYKSWIEAWKANRRMLQQRYQSAVESAKLDVVFLGESIGTCARLPPLRGYAEVRLATDDSRLLRGVCVWCNCVLSCCSW